MKLSTHFFRALFLAGFFLAFSRPAFGQTISDTLTILACHHFWKTGASVPDMNTRFNITVAPNPPQVNVTDSGDCTEFKFAPGVTFQDFCPVGFSDEGWTNGVTVADLLKIRKHLLGIEPIQPAFVQLAVDFDYGGTVSTFDMVAMMEIIVGRAATISPFLLSWLSFSTDNIPNDPNDPLSSDWTCAYSYNPAVSTDTIDLIAYKMGDIDGDANPDGPYQVPQNLPFATLSIADWTLQAGETALVPVYMAVDETFNAFQMGFTLDPATGSLDGVEPGIAPVNNIAAGIFPGTLNILSVLTISPDDIAGPPLFYIKITANQTFAVKDFLKLSSQTTPALWVDQNDSIHPFNAALSTRLLPEPSADIRVLPPSPNPFHDRTSILVASDISGTTRLEVLDATGRIVWTLESRLNAGDNTLDIPGDVMVEGSLAFYRLYSADWMVSGKLIRH